MAFLNHAFACKSILVVIFGSQWMYNVWMKDKEEKRSSIYIPPCFFTDSPASITKLKVKIIWMRYGILVCLIFQNLLSYFILYKNNYSFTFIQRLKAIQSIRHVPTKIYLGRFLAYSFEETSVQI